MTEADMSHHNSSVTPVDTGAMLEQLKSRNEIGKLFADLYSYSVQAEPSLQGTVVQAMSLATDERLQFTGGHTLHRGETESGRYEVMVNVDDGLQFYSDLMTKRPRSVQICAELLGIPEEEMDARKYAAFIFLHEMGHVYDFQKNAPTLEERRARREAEGQKLIVREMSPGKLANYLATDDGARWFAEHRENFHAAYDIETPEDLLATQETWYRELETEKIPDQFAVRMMKSVGLA